MEHFANIQALWPLRNVGHAVRPQSNLDTADYWKGPIPLEDHRSHRVAGNKPATSSPEFAGARPYSIHNPNRHQKASILLLFSCSVCLLEYSILYRQTGFHSLYFVDFRSTGTHNWHPHLSNIYYILP